MAMNWSELADAMTAIATPIAAGAAAWAAFAATRQARLIARQLDRPEPKLQIATDWIERSYKVSGLLCNDTAYAIRITGITGITVLSRGMMPKTIEIALNGVEEFRRNRVEFEFNWLLDPSEQEDFTVRFAPARHRGTWPFARRNELILDYHYSDDRSRMRQLKATL